MAPILIGTPVLISNMQQHYALLYLLLNGTPGNIIQDMSTQSVAILTVNVKRQRVSLQPLLLTVVYYVFYPINFSSSSSTSSSV